MHETSRRMGSKTQFEHARNAKTHKFLANFARAMCCAHGFGTRAPAPRMAERFFACSRNIRAGPFVYTGCSGFEFFGWQEKTPRRLPRSSTERWMTPMKSNSLLRSLALLGALAITVPAFAKPFSKTISISQKARIGKADLQAGEYRLQIDGNKAVVQKGKQVIAESEGRWEERSAKSAYDSVLVDPDGQVKEVRFAGQNRVFVFAE